ncbi:MAG TPA: hypothetical protein VGQ18_14040 [Gemmatimonadales bacterium]|nr:hypothetical protein [Gemmatimonadales bacterium]
MRRVLATAVLFAACHGAPPKVPPPVVIRGDARLGLPDDWFWVRATELTPQR